jgi:hypothetical protein
MDEWLVLAHVAAVLGLMLAHGVHTTVMWRFRREPDPERALAFFEVVPRTTLIRALLAAIVLTGVAAGFARSWWGEGWIWTSLVLLAVIAEAMRRWGGGYFGLIQAAAEKAIAARAADPAASAWQAEYDVARLSWHPAGVSAIGLGGLVLILWLMMFKPF